MLVLLFGVLEFDEVSLDLDVSFLPLDFPRFLSGSSVYASYS